MTSSRAMALVIRVKWPVFSAGGIMTWLEPKLEAVMYSVGRIGRSSDRRRGR